MFLFGVNPYQPTLDVALFIVEWTIVKRIWCCIKKGASKRLRPFSYNNFTDKKKIAATKKQCYFAFSVLNWVFTYRHSKSRVYKWLKFYISVN